MKARANRSLSEEPRQPNEGQIRAVPPRATAQVFKNPKLQAPEKLKIPNLKQRLLAKMSRSKPAQGSVWNLVLGNYLKLGVWSLVFKSPRLAEFQTVVARCWSLTLGCCLFVLGFNLPAQENAGINRVLQLDGTNSYVELPPNIFNGLTQATVEACVLWERFGENSRVFDFGKEWQLMGVYNRGSS